MKTLIDGYCRVLEVLIALALALMVVLVFGNVVLRYGFNSGITVSEELSRWCFVWLTFIGGVTAMREHSHLGMDSVVSKLPVWGKKFCFVLSHLLMIACCLLFLSGSWDQTVINIGVEAPATGLSSGFFYGIGVFFSGTALLILLWDLFAMLSGKIKDDELVQIRESEEELDESELEELQHEMELEMQKSKLSHDSAKK
jgi:TRAP-type C4-dicarboxylate transport system permease small subunit